jgi:hypothetical protein
LFIIHEIASTTESGFVFLDFTVRGAFATKYPGARNDFSVCTGLSDFFPSVVGFKDCDFGSSGCNPLVAMHDVAHGFPPAQCIWILVCHKADGVKGAKTLIDIIG